MIYRRISHLMTLILLIATGATWLDGTGPERL